jgi:heme-degrading monooxygenase HmoA
MCIVLVRHKVENYQKWKAVFDADGPHLKSGGCERFELLRNNKDATDLVVYLTFQTAEKAHAFFESPRLKEAMTRGGVRGQPEILYLDPVEAKRSSEMGIEIAA